MRNLFFVLISVFLLIFSIPPVAQGAANDFLNLCRIGTPEQIETAINAGADPNENRGLDSPILVAIKAGNVEAIKTLVKHGANVNAEFMLKGKEPTTPLFSSMDYNLSITKLLLELGADANQKVAFGDDSISLLMIAAMVGDNPDLIKLLLEGGANPDERFYINNKQGKKIALDIFDLLEGNEDIKRDSKKYAEIHALLKKVVEVKSGYLYGLYNIVVQFSDPELNGVGGKVSWGYDYSQEKIYAKLSFARSPNMNNSIAISNWHLAFARNQLQPLLGESIFSFSRDGAEIIAKYFTKALEWEQTAMKHQATVEKDIGWIGDPGYAGSVGFFFSSFKDRTGKIVTKTFIDFYLDNDVSATFEVEGSSSNQNLKDVFAEFGYSVAATGSSSTQSYKDWLEVTLLTTTIRSSMANVDKQHLFK